jgi:hypothetical protein
MLCPDLQLSHHIQNHRHLMHQAEVVERARSALLELELSCVT